MSVVAMVTLGPNAAPPPGLSRSAVIVVASQQAFTDHWLPLAHSLGLDHVPLFETGLVLDREDLAPVIRELETLAAHAAEHVPEQAAAHLIERVRLLLSVFSAVDPETVQEIFIG